MSVAVDSQTISSAEVLEFLENNPSFFIQNDSILTKMNLPNTVDGNIANFNDFQARKLKQKLTKYEDRIALLMRTAIQNEYSAQQLNQLVVDVLMCTNLEEMKIVLDKELKETFDLDYVSFSESHCVVQEKRVILKQVNANDVDYEIENADDVYSEATLKLENEQGEAFGTMTFASRNPQRFYDGQGDNLLDFFAQVVGLTWSRLIEKSE